VRDPGALAAIVARIANKLEELIWVFFQIALGPIAESFCHFFKRTEDRGLRKSGSDCMLILETKHP